MRVWVLPEEEAPFLYEHDDYEYKHINIKTQRACAHAQRRDPRRGEIAVLAGCRQRRWPIREEDQSCIVFTPISGRDSLRWSFFERPHVRQMSWPCREAMSNRNRQHAAFFRPLACSSSSSSDELSMTYTSSRLGRGGGGAGFFFFVFSCDAVATTPLELRSITSRDWSSDLKSAAGCESQERDDLVDFSDLASPPSRDAVSVVSGLSARALVSGRGGRGGFFFLLFFVNGGGLGGDFESPGGDIERPSGNFGRVGGCRDFFFCVFDVAEAGFVGGSGGRNLSAPSVKFGGSSKLNRTDFFRDFISSFAFFIIGVLP